MSEPEFRPGDLAVYEDVDRIRWGPWRIVRVLNGDVRVLVDGLVECAVPRKVLRKAGHDEDPGKKKLQ